MINLVCLSAACLAGCVERELTITSEPPGALVFVLDQEVGRTPVKVPFTWYGDYDVRLRLERNEGTAQNPVIKRYYLHTHKTAEAPWFEWIGIDLVSELQPGELKDEKLWAFALEPTPEVSNEDLVTRAKELKAKLDEPDELQQKKKDAEKKMEAEKKK